MICQLCNGNEFQELGMLGSRWYRKCRDCGAETGELCDSDEAEERFICEDDRDNDADLDFMDEEYPKDDENWDGQPDEMQEWHDFDPDC